MPKVVKITAQGKEDLQKELKALKARRPEIAEKINSEADPYSIPFEREPTNELRASLIRRMENVFKEMSGGTRNRLYNAVLSIEWLRQFSGLPYIHFISQFTAIISESYTCPFVNAKVDYPAFARVLSSASSVSNEALEALFLFPQKNEKGIKGLDGDGEKPSIAQEDTITWPLYELELQTGIQISPLVMLKKQWYNRPIKTPFYYNVMQEGVKL